MPPAKKAQTRTTKAQTGEQPATDANDLGEDLVAKYQAELAGKGLHAKIAWVQQHVGVVEKTGKVEFGRTKFDHMQEHGLINVLRPLLRIAGLSVTGGCTAPGGFKVDGNVYIVDYALTVTDIEATPGDGERSITRYFPNVGVDTADKGFNKAYTGAMKYALQKFFLVPTSDIDDNETLDVAAVRASQQQTAPKAGTVADHPTEEQIEQLRSAMLDAGVKPEVVVNNLTAGFSKQNLAELTRAQFAEFEPVAADLIAAARSRASS